MPDHRSLGSGTLWSGVGGNHFPDYQLDHERERRLQTVAVAGASESVVDESPRYVIVAGGLDAGAAADSIRALVTYTPQNPHQADPDWPFRGIDHVLVRCGLSGPTLLACTRRRVFDQASRPPATTTASPSTLRPANRPNSPSFTGQSGNQRAASCWCGVSVLAGD